MNNQIGKYMGLAVVVAAQVALSLGCSSTSSTTGTGGAGGGAGPAAGTGGSATAGTGGAGGAPAGPYAAICPSTVANHGPCITGTDVQCQNTCGPNKSGYKNCDCVGNMWACPVCSYLPGKDFSCYKITASTAACPMDPTDPTGMGLTKSGNLCTLPECTPCGSASANGYRDSTDAPKVGYCVCVANADPTMPSKYSCTSLKEYPPSALLPQ